MEVAPRRSGLQTEQQTNGLRPGAKKATGRRLVKSTNLPLRVGVLCTKSCYNYRAWQVRWQL